MSVPTRSAARTLIFPGTCSAPAHPFVETFWCSPARAHIRCGGKQFLTEHGSAAHTLSVPLTPELPPFVQRPDCNLLSRVRGRSQSRRKAPIGLARSSSCCMASSEDSGIIKWPRSRSRSNPLGRRLGCLGAR